jgi:hypothetical protein
VCTLDTSDEKELVEEAKSGGASSARSASPAPPVSPRGGGAEPGEGTQDLVGVDDVDESTWNPDLMPDMEILATTEVEAVREARSRAVTPETRTPDRSPSPRAGRGAKAKGESQTLDSEGRRRLAAQVFNLIAVRNSQGLAAAQAEAFDKKTLVIKKQHVVLPVFIRLGDGKGNGEDSVKEVPYATISSSGGGAGTAEAADPHGSCPLCGVPGHGESAHINPAKM